MMDSDDFIDDTEDVMAVKEAGDRAIPAAAGGRRAVPSALETREDVVVDWEGGREGNGRIRDLETGKHYKVRGASFMPGAVGWQEPVGQEVNYCCDHSL
jgi:hypothetical protein